MKGVSEVERLWYYGIFSDEARFEVEFTDEDFDVEVLSLQIREVWNHNAKATQEAGGGGSQSEAGRVGATPKKPQSSGRVGTR
jgi:hypothetical protein